MIANIGDLEEPERKAALSEMVRLGRLIEDRQKALQAELETMRRFEVALEQRFG